MTAPADVWAVETRPGVFVNCGAESKTPYLFIDEGSATDVSCTWCGMSLPEGFPRVVRFRLVRVDEPEQPDDYETHLLHDGEGKPVMYCEVCGVHANKARDVACWFGKPKDEPEQPQRDEVGELRECVRKLADLVSTVAEVAAMIDESDADLLDACAIDAARIVHRLAAQSGPAGEVGDG